MIRSSSLLSSLSSWSFSMTMSKVWNLRVHLCRHSKYCLMWLNLNPRTFAPFFVKRNYLFHQSKPHFIESFILLVYPSSSSIKLVSLELAHDCASNDATQESCVLHRSSIFCIHKCFSYSNKMWAKGQYLVFCHTFKAKLVLIPQNQPIICFHLFALLS